MSESQHDTDSSSTDDATTIPVTAFAVDGFDGETPAPSDIRAFCPRITYGVADADDDAGDMSDIAAKVGMDTDSLADLAASLARQQEQPVTYRETLDGPEVVSGFRRVYAVALAHYGAFDDAPDVSEIEAVSREYDTAEAARARFSENHFRTDLSATERARLIWTIQQARDMNQSDVAEYVGLSRSRISQIKGVLQLPEEAQARVDAGELDPLAAMRVHREFGADDADDADSDGESGESEPDPTVGPDTPEPTDKESEMYERLSGEARTDAMDVIESEAEASEERESVSKDVSRLITAAETLSDKEAALQERRELEERRSVLEAALQDLWAEAPERLREHAEENGADAEEVEAAIEALREKRESVDRHKHRYETMEAAVHAAETVVSAYQDAAEEVDPSGSDRFERLQREYDRLRTQETGDVSLNWLNGGNLQITVTNLSPDDVKPDDGRTVDPDAVEQEALSDFLEAAVEFERVSEEWDDLSSDADDAQTMESAAENADDDLSALETGLRDTYGVFSWDSLTEDYGEEAVNRLKQGIEAGEALSDLRDAAGRVKQEFEEAREEAENAEEALDMMDDLLPEIQDTRRELVEVETKLAGMRPEADDDDEGTRGLVTQIERKQSEIANARESVFEAFREQDGATQREWLDTWEERFASDLSETGIDLLSDLERFYERGEEPEWYDADDDGDDDSGAPARDQLTVNHTGGGWYTVTHTETGVTLKADDSGEDAAEELAMTWATKGLEAAEDAAKERVDTDADADAEAE